jgi:hypothetical protein
MNASVNRDELQRFKELFLKAAAEEADAVARMLAESADGDLLGKTEFALRDAVHRLGAKTLQEAANERAKKKRIKAAASPASAAARPAL